MPLTAETPVETMRSSRSTTSCCVADVHRLIRPCAPMSTASWRFNPGCRSIIARVLRRGPETLTRGLSRTINTTGSREASKRIPPNRKTRRSPMTSAASPPMTGPIAPPRATADVTTPRAQPTRERGVSAATSDVAAATVPLVAPCSRRRTTSSAGFWAKKMRPTVIAPPSIDRRSIGLRPNRSPSTPQMGLATAIARPDALAEAAVHRSSSCPGCTPRFLFRKIERNGNAKLNPKMAMNSANHRATRLRRQLTPPELTGGVVERGSPPPFPG